MSTRASHSSASNTGDLADLTDVATALIHHPYQPPGGFETVQPGVHKASTVLFENTAALKTRQWKDKSGEKQERTDNTLPATGEYLGDLSFDYELSGSASWKPVRVYNDGRKTIIEMPGTMQQTEAPTLLVVRKEGGLFTDDETVLVNYRVQGNRYIVDTVFDRAILIAGVGSSQDRVTISRRK